MSHPDQRYRMAIGSFTWMLLPIAFAVASITTAEPRTDGTGLLPPPPVFSKAESMAFLDTGKAACKNDCATQFGAVLGTVDGVTGYSNCQSTCITPQYSFLNLKTHEVTIHNSNPKDARLHYIGVIYQCVEYVRRWWMLNRGITFGSVDSAHEIIYLEQAEKIHSADRVSLSRSINGTAQRAPRRGDLIVYYPDRNNPLWRHGHVAVVVHADLAQGLVSIAEENYDNKPWRNPQAYSRQLQLFEVNGRYTLLDVEPGHISNRTGGRISGWIYPQADN